MTSPSFHFELLAQDGRARAGIYHTPHGTLPTPVYAPVGTQGAVKAITAAQLHELNATLVLANTYHLYLRPGDETIAALGGLHTFMNWHRPILTDSGGFQVFSLAAVRKIDEDGATFKSHLDGSLHRLTPERSIAIQQNLGADIIMAFDECSTPYDHAVNLAALRRTHAWAERSLAAKTRPDQALFGIVQGGIYPDLRAQSAEFITGLPFDGYAIGGLAVGETKTEMHAAIDIVEPLLPVQRPRYLMGVGTPEDLVDSVWRGIDIFDCVAPTRLARHKAAFLRKGRLNLARAEHARDPRPIDENCTCYTCRSHSRAYLRHMIMAREILAPVLISIHNLHTLINLMAEIRQAILEHRYQAFVEAYFAEPTPLPKDPS